MYLDTQTPPEKTEKMTGLVEISNMLRWPDAAKSHKENLWNIHSPLKRSPQHRALMYSPKAVTGWREVKTAMFLRLDPVTLSVESVKQLVSALWLHLEARNNRLLLAVMQITRTFCIIKYPYKFNFSSVLDQLTIVNLILLW